MFHATVLLCFPVVFHHFAQNMMMFISKTKQHGGMKHRFALFSSGFSSFYTEGLIFLFLFFWANFLTGLAGPAVRLPEKLFLLEGRPLECLPFEALR